MKKRMKIGVGLYLVTLAFDVLFAAPARFALAYVLLLFTSIFVDIPSLLLGAAFVALLPDAYSVWGVISPGNGRMWRASIGAREPTRDEQQCWEDAVALLVSYASRDLRPVEFYVIDVPVPVAMTRGRTIIVSRPLLYEDGLAAALGHEYGHVMSWDGCLTEGLHRLKLWSDPLRGGADAVRGGSATFGSQGAWLFGALRLLVIAAGGALARLLTLRPWAWYWRNGEFAADAFAASLGQSEDLRSYLEEKEQLLDRPQEWWKLGRHEHPPVAERIDRLDRLSAEVDF